MSSQLTANALRFQVSAVLSAPSTGPAFVKLSVKVIDSKPRTFPEVAVPVVMTKGPTPADRTIVIENVDKEDSITFSFPTVHDRCGFEKPSDLVDANKPREFVLAPGAKKSFIVRSELGVIQSHPDTENRAYVFNIKTIPEIFNPHPDHEIGHVEC